MLSLVAEIKVRSLSLGDVTDKALKFRSIPSLSSLKILCYQWCPNYPSLIISLQSGVARSPADFFDVVLHGSQKVVTGY